MPHGVSMSEIAKAAGVGRSAVSLVLSGGDAKYRISPETRRKVLAAARSLGFHRNELAASLKRGKSKTIAFIGGIRTGYVMEIVAGLNAAASENDYSLKLFEIEDGDGAAGIAAKCVGQMVDGAICRSLSEEALEVLRGELETRGIPLVLVDNSFPHEWCPRVVSDDLEGGRLATAHLASLGRERIAFVSFNATAGYSCERREGYRKGLEEARLPFDEALLLELDASEDYDEALDRELWRRLKGSRADAAFCVSDGLALRVLRLCHENGVRVPEELALVGYANLDFAAQAHPPLASVAQPFYEMGVAAFERLLVSMRGKRAKRGGTTRLPVELIVRASAPIKQEKTPVASHRGATRPAARARSPGRTP